jgi:uncharacterized protein (TIGR02145 family)
MSTRRIAYAAALGTVGSLLLIAGVSCNSDTGNNVKINEGTVTDADGNVYRTVKIGNQVWTAENLRSTKYNDGTPIPNLAGQSAWDSCFYTLAEAYCYYNNTTNADSIKKFGALYNWYAVNTGKLAPAGWHVPTEEDWDSLQDYLMANGYNWNESTTENKIAKSMAGKTDWQSSVIEGAVGNDLSKNNKSGFSAVPGGARDPDFGGFYAHDSSGWWWSATNWGATCTWGRSLSFDFEDFLRPFNGKNCGFSVRLVRDSNR